MTNHAKHGVTTAEFKHRALPLGDLERPGPGVVDLWFLDFARLGNPLQAEHQAHPPELNARQSRALRRFYLRLLLGSYLRMPGKDIEISRLIKGKPVLAGLGHPPPLDFSISNSAGCCLIGVAAGGSLGVDMELISRRVGDPGRLARRYFSPAEAKAIADLPSEAANEAFLFTWACKEAVVKGAGHGIANQLHRFTVSCQPGQAPAVLEMHEDDPESWRLAFIQPSREHIAAVALRHESLKLQPFVLGPPRAV